MVESTGQYGASQPLAVVPYSSALALIFALVQHVVPLRLQWPLAQLFPVAWAGRFGLVLGLSFLDIYGKNDVNIV